MTEPWQKQDLAHVRDHAGVRFVIVDAGMGKPRGNMVAHTVGGHKIFRGDECLLSRPGICAGDWVRSVCNYLPASRILRVSRTHIGGDVEFDCEYYKIDATICQPSIIKGKAVNWVPVMAPEAIHLTLAQNHATLLEEVKRLKRLIGEKNKEISAVAECYSNRVESLGNEAARYREMANTYAVENTNLRTKAESLEAQRDKAVNDHRSAIGQRDKERQGKWEAQEFVRRLKEALALKTKECDLLLGLYEAKTQQTQKPEILM